MSEEEPDPIEYSGLVLNAELREGWVSDLSDASYVSSHSPPKKKRDIEAPPAPMTPVPSTSATPASASADATVRPRLLRKRKFGSIMESTSVLNNLTQVSLKLGIPVEDLEKGFLSAFNLQNDQPMQTTQEKLNIHLRTVDY